LTVVVSGKPTQEAAPVNSAARPSVALFAGYTQPQEAELVLGSLQHGEYRLRQPIRLTVELVDGGVRLHWSDGGLSVLGKTTSDALTSVRSAILALAISKDASVANFVEPLQL